MLNYVLTACDANTHPWWNLLLCLLLECPKLAVLDVVLNKNHIFNWFRTNGKRLMHKASNWDMVLHKLPGETVQLC